MFHVQNMVAVLRSWHGHLNQLMPTVALGQQPQNHFFFRKHTLLHDTFSVMCGKRQRLATALQTDT